MKFAALLPRALRQFHREPLYAFASAGTLALAVAAAVTSFAVVKPALLDPLPYRGGHELVSILTQSGGVTSAVSAHVLRDLEGSAPPLTEFASIRPAGVTFAGDEATVERAGEHRHGLVFLVAGNDALDGAFLQRWRSRCRGDQLALLAKHAVGRCERDRPPHPLRRPRTHHCWRDGAGVLPAVFHDHRCLAAARHAGAAGRSGARAAGVDDPGAADRAAIGGRRVPHRVLGSPAPGGPGRARTADVGRAAASQRAGRHGSPGPHRYRGGGDPAPVDRVRERRRSLRRPRRWRAAAGGGACRARRHARPIDRRAADRRPDDRAGGIDRGIVARRRGDCRPGRIPAAVSRAHFADRARCDDGGGWPGGGTHRRRRRGVCAPGHSHRRSRVRRAARITRQCR